MGSKAGQQQQTPQELALATHAQNLMTDYKQRWLPVQQHLASQLEEMGDKNSAARKLAAGKASTDNAMAFQKSEQQLEAGLSNSGVSPGSSRGKLAITGMGTDQAAAAGLGKMMSEQQMDDAYTEGLGALMQLGRGERASVGQSMVKQAQASQQEAATDAQVSLMNRSNEMKLGGQVVGFGLQQGLGMLPSNNSSGTGGNANVFVPANSSFANGYAQGRD